MLIKHDSTFTMGRAQVKQDEVCKNRSVDWFEPVSIRTDHKCSIKQSTRPALAEAYYCR